jgi:hypothetical protein
MHMDSQFEENIFQTYPLYVVVRETVHPIGDFHLDPDRELTRLFGRKVRFCIEGAGYDEFVPVFTSRQDAEEYTRGGMEPWRGSTHFPLEDYGDNEKVIMEIRDPEYYRQVIGAIPSYPWLFLGYLPSKKGNIVVHLFAPEEVLKRIQPANTAN